MLYVLSSMSLRVGDTHADLTVLCIMLPSIMDSMINNMIVRLAD